MIRVSVLLLVFVTQLEASLFDWFSPMTPKAKEAEHVLESIDKTIERSLVDYNIPGIAVGVVVDGHLVYAKGFGYRDLEKRLPVTPNTLFALGSCTKAFTSFTVGTLIDEGLMAWDQPLIDVLPEFRLWDQYATHNLTLRDILTHRSGMPRHDFMWYNSSISRAEVMQRLRYLEPSCDIRERYQYNNLMYLTAGYAMEQITGKDWETLVSERILEPLEMHQTNFSVERMQEMDDFAVPYLEKDDVLKRMSFRNISTAGPAGSMNSCVTDLARWVAVHLNGGFFDNTSLISPATLQEMHAPQVVVTGAPELKETLLSAYGIGWNISSYRGEYYVSHDGGVDGFTSVVGLLPYKGVGIILLTNKNLTPLPRYLSFQILDAVLGLSPMEWLKEGLQSIQKSKETMEEALIRQDELRKKGTTPSHPLEEYVGEYFHPGYGKILVDLVDGKLETTFNGITSFLDHWHYDVFAVREESQDLILSREGMKFTFRTNVNGDIEELIIPFEASANDIVFKKSITGTLSDLEYLRQFTGFYEVYGYTVEVAVRDKKLCAIIPSQPIYELLPTRENEFSVKEITGYSVRFLLNDFGRVDEVLLIQPYGAIVAKPKHPTR